MKKIRYTEEQISFALKQAETGTRDDLDPDKPRTIELGDGWLSLVPVKE